MTLQQGYDTHTCDGCDRGWVWLEREAGAPGTVRPCAVHRPRLHRRWAAGYLLPVWWSSEEAAA